MAGTLFHILSVCVCVSISIFTCISTLYLCIEVHVYLNICTQGSVSAGFTLGF